MKVTLTKHIFGDLNIDGSKLIGVYGPKEVPGEEISEDEIKKVIKNPIGTEPLSKMAKGSKKVLIVTDDNTRATPLKPLLPFILDELHQAGVPEKGISFLIGLGTHRPMNRNEIVDKFGANIADKYKIVNHAWNDPMSLVSLGSCELGCEVVINKLAQDTDLLISIGSIVPHATTGFSGGPKTVVSGICGEETIENTHWMALNYPISELLGNPDNYLLKIINNICKRTKLKMVINTILSNDDKVCGIVAGDLDFAHKRGIELCKKLYSIPIPGKADIVIAEAYPTDINLRQAIKAICTADILCRDGGVIILPAECPEGVAVQFPEFVKYGFKNPDLLYQKVEEGTFGRKLAAYTLIKIGRIISKRVHAILISPNIDSAQAIDMGFLWAANLNDAVDKAQEIRGDNAKIIVLKQAGQLLPVLESYN